MAPAVDIVGGMMRRAGFAVVLVGLVVVLTGCVPHTAPYGEAPSSMTSTYPTPDESRATTLELFEATRRTIGGNTWVLDSEWYNNCPLPDGSEGAEYVRLESTDATFDAVEVAKRVAQLWQSRGFAGVVVEPFGPGYRVVYHKDARRVYLHVGITDFSATIYMIGGCIPGDSADLRNALVS